MGKLQTKFIFISILITLVCKLEAAYGAKAGHSSAIVNSGCLTTVGNVNEQYTREIKSDNTLLYVFPLNKGNLRNPQNQNIRVEASVSRQGTLKCPVIFVIGQQQYTTSMELPFTFTKNQSSVYYQGGRTLCVQDSQDPYRQDMRNITVRVSTCSDTTIIYSLRVSVTQDYLLPLEHEIHFQVSPTGSVVRGFSFSAEDVSSVKIRAISQEDTCATISIQPLGCPVYDLETNVQYSGLWQTMTRKAAMTVEHSGRYINGFDIAVVMHDTDEKCLRLHGDSDSMASTMAATGTGTGARRQKNIKIRISGDARVPNGYLFLCLFIPVASSFILIFLTIGLFRWRHRGIQKHARKIDVTDSFAMKQNGIRTSRIPDQSDNESDDPENEASPLSHEGDWSVNVPGSSFGDESGAQLESVLPESQLASAKSIVPPNQNISRHLRQTRPSSSTNPVKTEVRNTSGISIRADIHIGDFTKNQGRIQDKNARRFCWSLITVAVFYTIPVYQLIFHYLGVLYKTGEYDLCYYNYLCAYRVGYFLDFNHFFSNIGYVIFGVAFMWIVRRRDSNIKFRSEAHGEECGLTYSGGKSNLSRPVSTLQLQIQLEEEGRQGKCKCFPIVEYKRGFGVPQHFGVFYSLGLALIMEGFLSAAYHICPNQKNFQFDTCFMYVISVLIILKIYQFRHPIALDAHQTFLILAVLILVSVAGLMLEFRDAQSKLLEGFRISFAVLQFSLLILGSVYYYHVGYVTDEKNTILTDWKLFSRLRQKRQTSFHVDRLIQPFLTLLLCIAVVIYSEMTEMDFGTYLLYTFIANVLGSCFYYIVVMKPLHGEFKNGSWIQPTLYFTGCMIIGGFAVTYFVQSPAQWEKSASESRSENNVECMYSWFPFQPFYDVHDVWHFYSAAALFLAFMGLLTVDDDLVAVPQSRIPVF